jgi:hypothetical protein
MVNSSSKPPLVSQFFHTGPALSDFNSLGSLISNPITATNNGQNLGTQSNPAGSTTTAPSSTTNASTTTSTVTRVVVGASLPTPVACSPFTKSENQKIEIAWQSLHEKVSSSSIPTSSRVTQPNSTHQGQPHRSQKSSLESLDTHLEFQLKGKAKLTSEITRKQSNSYCHDIRRSSHFICQSKHLNLLDIYTCLYFLENNGHQENISSSDLPLSDNQATASDGFDKEDAVLNLSMEDHPHIVPVGLDSLFTVGMWIFKNLGIYTSLLSRLVLLYLFLRIIFGFVESDVRRLKLYPAFWHGPHLDVYKGQWFYPTNSKRKRTNTTRQVQSTAQIA